MTASLHLKSHDGHRFPCFQARPRSEPLGGVVVIQEIFGVNHHIREVAQGYAQAGFLALAPCLFERVEPGLELGYTEADVARGREAVARLGFDAALADIAAAAAYLRGLGLAAGTVGYCWGGTAAALCATRIGLPSVSYYGARSLPYLHERPQAPLLMHFGETDPLFPLAAVARVREAWPEAEIHLYPAGHGFNCSARADYHADSAGIALRRSTEFLRRHLARPD